MTCQLWQVVCLLLFMAWVVTCSVAIDEHKEDDE